MFANGRKKKNMNINWDLVFGTLLIVTGFVWILKRSIPVGIEGKKPSFYVKGKLTVFIGGLLIFLGILVITGVMI